MGRLKAWGMCAGFVAFCVGNAVGGNPLQAMQDQSIFHLMKNLTREDITPGAVIASPSRSHPDYFYHWVRDGALVMNVVLELYKKETEASAKRRYFELLKSYVSFSRKNQLTPTQTGLGEPKFYVNGAAFDGPWGRPQNDGPALRAITLIEFAKELSSEGRRAPRELYAVIRSDLDYTTAHFKEPCFDYWEEVLGFHFSTRMVQRKALVLGAELAKRFKDDRAYRRYREVAIILDQELSKHWDSERQLIRPTLNRSGGLDYKKSDLDVAVLLGVLHGELPGWSYGFQDKRVHMSLISLIRSFQLLYPINRVDGVPGVAIGRYPEDRYNGYATDQLGNPWVLATAGVAELFYRMGEQKVGDSYLARVIYHRNPDGSLSEQINRFNGYMQGAPHLSWSYASFISARLARRRF